MRIYVVMCGNFPVSVFDNRTQAVAYATRQRIKRPNHNFKVSSLVLNKDAL